MSERPFAWVLNLDAEQELEGGPRYAPTHHVTALVRRQSQRLLGDLVRPQDVVVTAEGLVAGDARAQGLVGLAWCPTPRARLLLERAGATPPETPPLEILRRVNARPFAAALRAPRAGASFAKDVADDLAQVLELLRRPAADGWLVRRTFGAAGRGRRRIATGPPDASERAWLVAGLRRGPLTIEPWVRVTREYTRSGWIASDGSVRVAPPCGQVTSPQGAWTRTEALTTSDVAADDDQRLGRMAEEVGRALAAEGYFGPFGIDAYRHRLPGRDGDVLNPLSEINARFTMDWTVGMATRPELDREFVR
jgi:hypothetical protein